jgi:hypothetical protein
MSNAKKWTKKDYTTQAEEFVSCYGKGYCRDEFVSDYCQLFEGRLPFDPDKLQDAILTVEQAS